MFQINFLLIQNSQLMLYDSKTAISEYYSILCRLREYIIWESLKISLTTITMYILADELQRNDIHIVTAHCIVHMPVSFIIVIILLHKCLRSHL